MYKYSKLKTNLKVDFVLIIILLMGIFKTSTALTNDTPEIYMTISSISPNSECDVSVWVRDIPIDNATFAYQIAMLFNTSFLECIESSIPEPHDNWIFSGLTTLSPEPIFDNVRGSVVVGVSLLGERPVIGSGSFLLAVVKFNVKTQLELGIDSYVSISDPDTYILNEDLEDISPIRKQNSCRDSVWSSIAGKQEVYSSSRPPEFGYSSDGMKGLASSLREGSDELIVGLNQKVSDAFTRFVSLAEENEVNIVDTVSANGEIVAAVVKAELQTMFSFTAQLRTSGLSRYIEPNLEVKAFKNPNDPGWSSQWGSQKIQADYAWNTTLGNHSILVAVVDSGIDYTHEDISSNYNASGYDWVNNDIYPMDDYGHGTHCAGIIAAVINNSVGIAGVGQVQVMAEKVLDGTGYGSDSDIANAIYHATDSGARIISMSLGGYIPSPSVYYAVKYAYNKGVLLVAAAGNDATMARAYPAAYDQVIAVAATNETDDPASFTNYGDWIELSAPGVNINSTVPGNSYASWSGTSMAAPYVSGVAALIMSQYPNMTRDAVRFQLRFTVDDLGPSGFDEVYGWGRINARKAVEEGQPDHDLAIIEWDAPRSTQPGQTVYVNTTVLNFGISDESNVTVELRINDTTVDYDEVNAMQSSKTCVFNTSWTPLTNGTFKMESIVLPATGENRTSNNIASAPLIVRFPTTIYVPQNYTTIQSAIDAATEQDIIRVSNGTYQEHLVINKTMSIYGEDKYTTVVDGEYVGTIVSILTDGVTLSGFTIQNSGSGEGILLVDSCIHLASDWNNITDNIVKNGQEGIYLPASDNNEISNNLVTNCIDCGIFLTGADKNSITTNTIANSWFGICNYNGCMDNKIYKNNVTSHIYSGIYEYICQNTEIIENKITSNGWDGVTALFVENCKMKDNFLMENGWQGSMDDPFYGFLILGGDNHAIYHNTVIDNDDQVCAEMSSINWSGRWNVTGNYWSDYTGNDTDGDGIGEDSYIIIFNDQDNFPFMNPYLPGDITHDGQVDMRDIGRIARAYGTEPGDPYWNPKADLTEDAVVDDQDMDIAISNMWKTWQDYWGID